MSAEPPVVVDVDTAQGPGRLLLSEAERPHALLVLGHGAGGGVEGVDLLTLSRLLPAQGVTVARYVQPWKVSGRRIAVRPALLDEAWTPAVRALREVLAGVPLVVGGHSAGARVACRTADATGAAGVLALSFPLHPPGRPASSRLPELLAPRVPVLVVQGERDPFGSASEVRLALEDAGRGRSTGIEVVEVPAAGHDLLPRRASGVDAAAWWQARSTGISDWIGGIAAAPHSL
ncbi:MAG TPA: alpha/beta family hydrolase [Propionibacteriaceae bacterium]|nr:alpha/beta family hydrolase [Propionibacteriaceae bacterium]